MKAYCKLIFFLALMGSVAHAQNLVPNSSFEEVTGNTNRWIANHLTFEELIEEWTTPNQGSPDLFANPLMNRFAHKRKGIDLSLHKSRTGDRMVGIKTYGCETFTQHCKEYLQVKLKASIKKGEQYKIEFYANAYATSPKVNNLGVAFTDVEIQDDSEYGLYYISPALVESEIISSAPNDWHKVSGIVTADNNYEYLLIGNFFEDEDTKITKANNTIEYTYYFLDDVSVTPIIKSFENQIEDQVLALDQPIVLNNILFETAKSELVASSFVELDGLYNYLLQNGDLQIEINGHTDSQGEADYNYQLSENRALAVLDYLMKKGIERSRMTYAGYGMDFPLAGNDTEEGRELNRRVEFVLKN